MLIRVLAELKRQFNQTENSPMIVTSRLSIDIVRYLDHRNRDVPRPRPDARSSFKRHATPTAARKPSAAVVAAAMARGPSQNTETGMAGYRLDQVTGPQRHLGVLTRLKRGFHGGFRHSQLYRCRNYGGVSCQRLPARRAVEKGHPMLRIDEITARIGDVLVAKLGISADSIVEVANIEADLGPPASTWSKP